MNWAGHVLWPYSEGAAPLALVPPYRRISFFGTRHAPGSLAVDRFPMRASVPLPKHVSDQRRFRRSKAADLSQRCFICGNYAFDGTKMQ